MKNYDHLPPKQPKIMTELEKVWRWNIGKEDDLRRFAVAITPYSLKARKYLDAQG